MTDAIEVAPYDADGDDDRISEAFAAGEIPVAVYGLGKMGLPLAAVYAETAGNVTGVDVDPDVVGTVSRGESHVDGEPGLDELVADQVDAGRLTATTDGAAAASQARIHVIIVPTLLDENQQPDLSTIEAVVDDIATGLQPGDLVIAESTLPPGTCRDVIRPHLAAESGISADAFGVAFCPERTSSGRALQDIRGAYPKVVGGVDAESTRAAALVYDELSANEIHAVSDATTAEAVKVFEGIYRDVNIGLANELARVCESFGVSAREAFATANDLPMCQLHDPGPGVGGHCIPFYPHFVLSQADEMPITRAAREVNDGMPGVTVDHLEAELAAVGTPLSTARVAVLGITYRPEIEETRASPGVDVVTELRERGATVFGADPMVDPAEFGAEPVRIDDLTEHELDAAVLVTPHEAFAAIDWPALDPMVVVDGRDALELGETDHRVFTLGGSESGSGPAAETGRADGRTQPAEHTPDRRVLTADSADGGED
ncbi:nucleotide sugar dehydrogenase [Halobacteria archaeon AArc-dxtr1]|nr:nucleotide sugar dehydrogenase [Halobacteria archaeon AArc-dxtr1]